MDNEEIYNLYSSPDIIGVNKGRGMRCVRHVARTTDIKNA